MPGIQAENVFSISYAKASGKSYANQILRGGDLPAQKRYASITSSKYNEKNFRRILERPEDMASKRDYLEYSITINRTASTTSKNFMKQTGSYDKYTKEYFDPSLTTNSPQKFKRDLNGSQLIYAADQIVIRPKLIESGLVDNPKYQKLPSKFQRIFAVDEDDQKMKLPIVGYCGHRKGEKAENIYAKNYRDLTLKAAQNLRAHSLVKSFYQK